MDIRLEEVSFAVRGRAILQGITGTINGGTLTCLLGANGSGKTTLLRILCGELRPTSGRVLVDASDITRLPSREMARYFAIVPQGVGDPPYLTVSELVALGRFQPTRRLWWDLTPQDRQVVAQCLRRCQVDGAAERPVAQLSGGEKQRAWLAFALAQEKEFLLLDEALDALDLVARRTFFQLLVSIASEGRGVLLTTHDLGLASEYASRIIVLDGGRMTYDGPASSRLHQLTGPALGEADARRQMP
jgi:iron complex transport system ATP-binding protein